MRAEIRFAALRVERGGTETGVMCFNQVNARKIREFFRGEMLGHM
jgi:hypothetical protein